MDSGKYNDFKTSHINNNNSNCIDTENMGNLISVTDLRCEPINDKHNNLLCKAIKTERKTGIRNFLLSLVSFVFIVGIIIYLIVTRYQFSLIHILFLGLFFITTLSVCIQSLKSLISLKLPVPHSQYGIVYAKNVELYRNNNITQVRNWYCTVHFPNDSTYLSQVKCSEESYNSLSKGDSVLVISTDNVNALCIPV